MQGAWSSNSPQASRRADQVHRPPETHMHTWKPEELGWDMTTEKLNPSWVAWFQPTSLPQGAGPAFMPAQWTKALRGPRA